MLLSCDFPNVTPRMGGLKQQNLFSQFQRPESEIKVPAGLYSKDSRLHGFTPPVSASILTTPLSLLCHLPLSLSDKDTCRGT